MTSDDCEVPDDAASQLDGVDGVLIPGGFGVRGIEGKIGAIRYAREHKIPLLGLCLGLQCAVIEVARNMAGLPEANSAEFDPSTPDPVIATMADQQDVVAGSGTWAAPCGWACTRRACSQARSSATVRRRGDRGGAAPAPL